METTQTTDLATITADVNADIRRYAATMAPIDGVNPATLRGLCATGAAVLLDRLAQNGIAGEHIVARSVFGNALHCLVKVGDTYLDPTAGQFEGLPAWYVGSEPPAVTYHGRPCMFAAEPLPATWPRGQHPEMHAAALAA